jgi:hypothetical protein
MALQFRTECPNVPVMVSTFREVVALWPSPDALASDLGAGVAAARKWSHRNSIPAEWWLPLLRTDVARKAGLTADDLAALAAARNEART